MVPDFSETRFYDAIFQGVEGDNTESSSRIQKVDHAIDRILQNIQFRVDFDADCLKCFLCKPFFPFLTFAGMAISTMAASCPVVSTGAFSFRLQCALQYSPQKSSSP